jgi:hypothetical protein
VCGSGQPVAPDASGAEHQQARHGMVCLITGDFIDTRNSKSQAPSTKQTTNLKRQKPNNSQSIGRRRLSFGELDLVVCL